MTPDAPARDDPALLSVVITFDPHPGLVQHYLVALESFAVTHRQHIELIVVDDLGCLAGGVVAPIAATTWLDLRCLATPGIGQSAAMLHGLKEVRGAVALTMDPDMSGNVPDIHRMLALWHAGCDLVYARRLERTGVAPGRRMASAAYNFCVRVISGLPLHDINTPMVLLSRRALGELPLLVDSGRAPKLYLPQYLRGQFGEVGIRVVGECEKRSTYDWKQLVVLATIGLRDLFGFVCSRIGGKPRV